MSEVRPLVLIAGPPGVGKSTVAKHLIALSNAPLAYVEGDAFWCFFAKTLPMETEADARRRDVRIMVQAMIAAALRYTRGGYETILDFTLGPWSLAKIQSAVKEVPLDYVVLRASEPVCAARAARRAGATIEEYAQFRGLHGAFADMGAFERHALDNEGNDPAGLAALIRAGLDAGTYRVASLP